MEPEIAAALTKIQRRFNELDRQADQLLTERDRAQEAADELSSAIAAYFDVDIGEHSNLNDPWAEALEVIRTALRKCERATKEENA